MIDKIVEMISVISIPQGIMIGFCAFLEPEKGNSGGLPDKIFFVWRV
jgi:hypothetical protein